MGEKFINELNEFCGNKKRIITKIDEPTNPEWGWIPRNRPLEKYIEYGVINLDKPPGPTSHEVVAWIKRMFNLKRAGHGGTLEPR
jgi:hypothetical protein